jgi:hypothetical protein
LLTIQNKNALQHNPLKLAIAIEKSIKVLNSLTFLTKQDNEDILYNNAVRSLQLKNNCANIALAILLAGGRTIGVRSSILKKLLQ